MRLATTWLAAALVCALATAAGGAQFGPDQYPIKSDEGDPITNFDLKPDLLTRLAKLPGQVAVGNPHGGHLFNSTISIARSAARPLPMLMRLCLRTKN